MSAKAMRSLDFGLYFFIHTDVTVKKSSITFNKLATDEKVSLIMFKIAWRGAPIFNETNLSCQSREKVLFMEIYFFPKINVIKWFKFGLQFNGFLFYILRNNLK